MNIKLVVPALAGLLMACTAYALELQYAGQTFKDCSMTRVELAGVSYMHSGGVVKIPFDKLPAAEQATHQAAIDALQAKADAEVQAEAAAEQEREALRAEWKAGAAERDREWQAGAEARAEVKARRDAQTEQQQAQKERAKYDGLVAGMKECGFVHSINMTTHDVFVDPAVWNLLEYDKKEMWVGVLSVYFDQRDGLSHVIICSKYDKKKLCKLAPFVGFKIY
jgi:hypothetical protein